MISEQAIRGNWSQFRTALQEKWGQLTDNDFAQMQGDLSGLVGLIQKKTGDARDGIEDFCESVLANGESTVGNVAEQARKYVSNLGSVAHEQYEHAAETMTDGLSQAQQTIRRHPAESMAVTFGAGLIAGAVLGLLLRNRS